MQHVGMALHPDWKEDKTLINEYAVQIFQIMTHDTKSGNIIWTTSMINMLRSTIGQHIRIYAHSVFKVVLGKPYTYYLFTEHYKYACDNNLAGYVVHIPANIEVNYCIEVIVKLLKSAHKKLNYKKYTTVYFEHVPSEYYSVNMHIFGKLLRKRLKQFAIPIGLCIDTCHLFVSGISFADSETVRHYMLDIEAVGLPILIHLNDSVGDFASFVDRHDALGAKIWKDDVSGLKFIKNTHHDKILEIADCKSSMSLLSEL